MTFKKGASGNPNGRPKRTVEEAALEKFRSRYRNGEWEVVLDALNRQVQKGNIRAIELVFEYLLGKPAQPVDMNAEGIIKVIVEYERAPDKAA